MTREIKILFNFLSYLFLGFLICLIGLSNVFASTYYATQFEAKLFDNYGPSLSGVTTSFTNDSWRGVIPSMTANTSGAAWGFSSPIAIIANHTYALSVVIDGTYGGNLTLSTYNRIGIGSSMSSAEESYENNTKVKELSSKAVPSNNMIQFVFTAESSASYIVFPFATTYTGTNQNFYFTNVIIDDLGSNSLTQDEINNSLTNQTNTLNNSINNSTNIITGEIDNLGEDIKDTFNACFYNYFNISNFSSYSNDHSSSANRGEYIEITSTTNTFDDVSIGKTLQQMAPNIQVGKTYTISFSGENTKNYVYMLGSNFVWYVNEPRTITSSDLSSTMIFYNQTYPGTGNVRNIMIQEYGKESTGYIPYGEKCTNKIDETNDKIDETNNQLGDLNNNITNDNIDDNNVSNAFSEFENFVDENATISTLITLPVTLFSAILNGLNNSCTPFNLGSLYGEDLILPCINLSTYLGNTLWTMIDIIISGFAIYFISQKFIKVFNNFSSMKEGDVIDD